MKYIYYLSTYTIKTRLLDVSLFVRKFVHN